MRRRRHRLVVGAALPVFRRRAGGHAFPPGLVVGGDADVGEDGIAVEHRHGIGIGLFAGARRHAEITRLGVDRVQAAVFARAHPADVVADRPDLPAVAAITFRRDEHGQVGLAAGRRERRRDIVGFTLRILDADDQHVFGQPALVAGLVAGDAQGVALLAQQGVAAVARAVALDGQFFREMHDEAAVRIEFADRVQALDETTLALDARQRRRAHAGHQAHVRHHVGAVGDLDAAARQRRVDRAHAIGNDVHGAAAHAALVQGVHLGVGLVGRHPVVVRTGVGGVVGADEGEVFDARHVRGAGPVQVAVRMGLFVELHQVAGAQHQLDQPGVFGVGAVAPVHGVGLGELGDRIDPLVEAGELACHDREGSCRGLKGKVGRS